jgi:hypothetical protein
MSGTNLWELPGTAIRSVLALGVLSLVLFTGSARGQPNVQIGENFRGLGLEDNLRLVGERVTNPDMGSDVGPQSYVQFVKRLYAVYDKNTGALVQNTSGNTFWNNAGIATLGGGMVTDPRVVYDRDSGRWFAAAIDLGPNPNNFLLAVSNTADPTQGWKGFQFRGNVTNSLTDFPTLGVDRQGVFLGSNNFNSNLTAVALTSIPKADLLLPTPTIANRRSFDPLSFGDRGYSFQPVTNPESSPGHSAVLATGISGNVLKRFDVLNPGTSSPTLSATTNINVPAFTDPFFAHQPDGTRTLASRLDRRIGSSVFQVGQDIWAVHNVQVGGFVGIRWYEIEESTNRLLQSGTISALHFDYIYPSIAANPFGEVVIGFTATGDATTGLFPSAFALAGTTTNGITTFGDPILLAAGLDNFHFPNEDRWGDYSSTSVDPNDPHTFWTAIEIALPRSAMGGVWGTQITALTFGAPVPEPASVLLTSIGLACLLGYGWRCRKHIAYPRVG